jgi:hypothetical protein
MARAKYDGVVEAVHYSPDGKVDWVRAYERRGSTFSERLLLDRDTLIHRMKHGKRYVSGQRLQYMGSTFDIAETLNLVANRDSGREVLVTSQGEANQDDLKGVPII